MSLVSSSSSESGASSQQTRRAQHFAFHSLQTAAAWQNALQSSVMWLTINSNRPSSICKSSSRSMGMVVAKTAAKIDVHSVGTRAVTKLISDRIVTDKCADQHL